MYNKVFYPKPVHQHGSYNLNHSVDGSGIVDTVIGLIPKALDIIPNIFGKKDKKEQLESIIKSQDAIDDYVTKGILDLARDTGDPEIIKEAYKTLAKSLEGRHSGYRYVPDISSGKRKN